MTSPRISVLIPTFNYARYLPEAIESVLAQDFPDFELLIADDCSADGSDAVIARYAAQDRRVQGQVHKTRLGMVPNWNWCLSQARGEYIKFVFGDDKLASPQALSRLLGLMESNPSVTLAGSARYLMGASSELLEVWDDFGAPGTHKGTDVICRCLKEDLNLIGEPTVVLFRKRDAGRGFSPRYRQLVDLEFWFNLLENGDFAYTREPLSCFRKHAEQQSRVNAATELGNFESLQLFEDYRSKPYNNVRGFRLRQFNRLYDLRKRRQRGAPAPSELLAMESALSARMPRSLYLAFWARRRITRPFDNLCDWLARRRLQARRTAVRGP